MSNKSDFEGGEEAVVRTPEFVLANIIGGKVYDLSMSFPAIARDITKSLDKLGYVIVPKDPKGASPEELKMLVAHYKANMEEILKSTKHSPSVEFITPDDT